MLPDLSFLQVRPLRILWKAEKEKIALDEIARLEKEIEGCKDFKIPQTNVSVSYKPIWSMMDGK